MQIKDQNVELSYPYLSRFSQDFILETKNFKYLAQQLQHFSINIVGPKGSGKSYSLLYLACIYKCSIIITPSMDYDGALTHLKQLDTTISYSPVDIVVNYKLLLSQLKHVSKKKKSV